MIRDFYTEELRRLILGTLKKIQNPIFVFVGLENFVHISKFNDNIVDIETFGLNANDSVYSKQWFARVFPILLQPHTNPDQNYHILSLPQFSYIDLYSPHFFEDRIVIVSDGIRALFPLKQDDFVEKGTDENIEKRPDDMPIYMADQVKINDKFFYTLKSPSSSYKTIKILNEYIELQQSTNKDARIIDITSDPYGLDLFINQCLDENNFLHNVLVKYHVKYPQDKKQIELLQSVNALLNKGGGSLGHYVVTNINTDYTPSDKVLSLLHHYWGDKAEFRTLRVYDNPDYENSVTSISQGLIVETIIGEYDNAKNGRPVRDLFLTAPTGAGKSLLFQLPAFHISAQSDVTIVVSPLIALMEDQVQQIHKDREYHKVAFINSNLSLIDRDKIIEGCKNGEIDIIYMSPELLLSYDISFFLGDRNLGLLVIDEAHLITTWGRDFRVDYWFLGQHIDKMRKHKGCQFPLVAVTATAIYGGDNDMVFDSINSLYMHNPHVFIGEVKRHDITFVIDNHDKYRSNYDAEKRKETTSFVKEICQIDAKTIVYVPYTSDVDKMRQMLDNDNIEGVVSYHSSLGTDAKDLAYRRYKSGDAKVMLATKAFGMGVDISDIQIVYHHAPSGMLPDYVQEIGRAARRTDISGYAALSYSEEDQRYSKVLHGISSLKQYQIREVINKIHKIFIAQGSKRNMLLAAEDFAYIFNVTDDVDQKVMTALMMIEKDYLAKYRFNVIVARPKKLFVKVFARTNRIGFQFLNEKYSSFFKKVSDDGQDRYEIILDLDKLWQQEYSDNSFPFIKSLFYKGKLFEQEGINLTPLVQMKYTLSCDARSVARSFDGLISVIQNVFNQLRGGYFSKTQFGNLLADYIGDEQKREKIIKFILSSYSGRAIDNSTIEGDAFLQRRKSVRQEYEYRLFNNQYLQRFASLRKKLSVIVSSVGEDMSAYKFISSNSGHLQDYIRLGSLLEILELATYETRGGDNPMIFIRINDPLRIQRDAVNSKYDNSILSKTTKRHKTSFEIFDHFFMHSFKNEERWSFIEDYFLGASIDDLLARYPGGERNHVNIVKYISDNIEIPLLSSNEDNDPKESEIHVFHPTKNEYFDENRYLTIGNKTQKVSRWLIDDPVALDKIRREYELSISSDVFKILISKLKNHHFAYFRDSLGLRLKIDIEGYPTSVPAQTVYLENPLKFYKWWKVNEDKIYMTKREILELIVKINEISPKTLVKRHKELLQKKKI